MANAPDVPDHGDVTEHQNVATPDATVGTDETAQRVVIALARVGKRLDGYYRAQLANLGLHPGDWTVLQELARHSASGSCSPSHLADIAGVSPSTMTHRLDLLAERGLIQREADPRNRTRSRVSCTQAGKDLFTRGIREENLVEATVLGTLSCADRRKLAELLERLLAGPSKE